MAWFHTMLFALWLLALAAVSVWALRQRRPWHAALLALGVTLLFFFVNDAIEATDWFTWLEETKGDYTAEQWAMLNVNMSLIDIKMILELVGLVAVLAVWHYMYKR